MIIQHPSPVLVIVNSFVSLKCYHLTKSGWTLVNTDRTAKDDFRTVLLLLFALSKIFRSVNIEELYGFEFHHQMQGSKRHPNPTYEMKFIQLLVRSLTSC